MLNTGVLDEMNKVGNYAIKGIKESIMKRSIKKTVFVGTITACLALGGLALYSSAQNAATDLTVWLPAGSPEDV